MPDKRMRPIVKQEPGADGAQQQQQQVAAAGERDGQLRSVEKEARAAGGLEQQLQSLRAYADAQAFACQGLSQVRAMGEQLLQAKAEVAELKAEIRIKDAALEAKDVALQSKDAVIEAKDALIRRLQSEVQDDALAAAGAAHCMSARATCDSDAAAPASSANKVGYTDCTPPMMVLLSILPSNSQPTPPPPLSTPLSSPFNRSKIRNAC
jgi:hypothetical protein